jgi:hypothetical protein
MPSVHRCIKYWNDATVLPEKCEAEAVPRPKVQRSSSRLNATGAGVDLRSSLRKCYSLEETGGIQPLTLFSIIQAPLLPGATFSQVEQSPLRQPNH